MTHEIEHRYGENVHILDDPLAMTLLAKLCANETVQPEVNRLVAALYRQLVCTVIRQEMPTKQVNLPTRMTASEKRAIWSGSIIDPRVKVAVVCVARAGIFPSQVCYDLLNELLTPAGVRQDHMLMNRTTNAAGEVDGAAIQGAKIGGPIDNSTLLIPDPMGATGTTIVTLLEHYQRNVEGTAAKTVALNLIITPEYIRRIESEAPGTKIYAYRLDRGLSPDHVLAAVPGEYWDQEVGLNEHGYIIPGGGGFGEVMNNAFV
ncbi:MAG: uracil phosphoribosyltransferase [Deltaproteobacteria bacterium]|nr:uracil phosphoribosyltransferase [Deltaproteobacteria bacterium]